jgi:hypothetical protein
MPTDPHLAVHPMRQIFFELADEITLHHRTWELISEDALSTEDTLGYLEERAAELA